MENTKHATDGLISALRTAAIKLEELQVQAALGKAEASDKVDEVKSSFKSLLSDAKNQINKGGTKFNELKGKIEHLELQMALGKAEAKETIEEQKKSISHTIHEIENFFKTNFK